MLGYSRCAPDGWTDMWDQSCDDYRLKEFCTISGEYGSAWIWGLFENNSNDEYSGFHCAECGCKNDVGKSSSSTTLTSTTTTTATTGQILRDS